MQTHKDAGSTDLLFPIIHLFRLSYIFLGWFVILKIYFLCLFPLLIMYVDDDKKSENKYGKYIFI